jgi:hypothetical protein
VASSPAVKRSRIQVLGRPTNASREHLGAIAVDPAGKAAKADVRSVGRPPMVASAASAANDAADDALVEKLVYTSLPCHPLRALISNFNYVLFASNVHPVLTV